MSTRRLALSVGHALSWFPQCGALVAEILDPVPDTE
jgi:hypothetical protein